MSDSNEDLREELAKAKAVNAHLFLAIDALARSTFDMLNLAGAPAEKRAGMEADIRSNTAKLDAALAEARGLIWESEAAPEVSE